MTSRWITHAIGAITNDALRGAHHSLNPLAADIEALKKFVDG